MVLVVKLYSIELTTLLTCFSLFQMATSLVAELTTTTAAIITTLNDSATASNCTSEKSSLLNEIVAVDKYVSPVTYVVGFPGNFLSFMVWIQPRMRHSSGVYLAALALVDFIFLTLHVLYELHYNWEYNIIDHNVICESFTTIFLTFQYLAPLLVLGFTVERYISICHPFKRERFCTTKRAKIVTCCLALFSLALCGIQGYFYHIDENGICDVRPETVVGGNSSLWNIWTWITDLLIFLVVPLCVLTFNILVIREAKRLSAFEQSRLHTHSQKTSATTIMLLAVSFYLIFTTLPVTIVYASVLNFGEGPPCVSQNTDPTWQRHYTYVLWRKVIEEIGITHFALNFYIYLITGKQFRKEFKRLLIRKGLPEKLRTEYTALRRSIRGSFLKNGDSSPKSVTVRLTENGTTTTTHGGDTTL